MSTLVTGGTGWIGKHLITKLDGPVHVVSRNATSARAQLGNSVDSVIECDLTNERMNLKPTDKFETVINLMGASLADGRWNDRKKESLRRSRIDATSNLVASLLQCDVLPSIFVSASAIGFYGDQGDNVCKETTTPGSDFLATLCKEWEAATCPLAEAGVRVLRIRIGIVLGRGGGAADKLLTLFRWGLGGRLGSGQQWMSWIHLDDLVAAILFLIQHESLCGPVNLVASDPVQNVVFAKTLAASLRRPALLPVPAAMLRLVIGEFADYLLASQRVQPTVLVDNGFEFGYPTIETAWQEIVSA